jgi:hypothetical protein
LYKPGYPYSKVGKVNLTMSRIILMGFFVTVHLRCRRGQRWFIKDLSEMQKDLRKTESSGCVHQENQSSGHGLQLSRVIL